MRRYKVPLREVPRGVAQERNPSVQHLTAWENKVNLVVVNTMFLSAAREAECREAPSRGRFALSPSWWRSVKKWKSRQYVSSTSIRTTRTFCTGDSYALKFEKLRGEK